MLEYSASFYELAKPERSLQIWRRYMPGLIFFHSWGPFLFQPETEVLKQFKCFRLAVIY